MAEIIIHESDRTVCVNFVETCPRVDEHHIKVTPKPLSDDERLEYIFTRWYGLLRRLAE